MCYVFALVFCFQVCGARVESTEEAAAHYKAVCRALVAEAIDLTTFLEKMNNEREVRCRKFPVAD
jgi:Kinase non-catalytic C-lobe domain